MKSEKIASAAGELHSALLPHAEKFKIGSPTRLDPARARTDTTFAERLSHTMWLLEEIPNLLADGRREKAMRWLCWCQGLAFEAGFVHSIETLKQANRPDEE